MRRPTAPERRCTQPGDQDDDPDREEPPSPCWDGGTGRGCDGQACQRRHSDGESDLPRQRAGCQVARQRQRRGHRQPRTQHAENTEPGTERRPLRVARYDVAPASRSRTTEAAVVRVDPPPFWAVARTIRAAAASGTQRGLGDESRSRSLDVGARPCRREDVRRRPPVPGDDEELVREQPGCDRMKARWVRGQGPGEHARCATTLANGAGSRSPRRCRSRRP